jgi:hypothetical protein
VCNDVIDSVLLLCVSFWSEVTWVDVHAMCLGGHQRITLVRDKLANSCSRWLVEVDGDFVWGVR